MSDKSYVSIAQRQCVVCGEVYDTGEILINKRLRDSMDRHTVVGTGLCPVHQKMRDDGYVMLIVANENHERTGALVQVRASVWLNLFNTPAPNGGVAYISPDVLETLQSRMES